MNFTNRVSFVLFFKKIIKLNKKYEIKIILKLIFYKNGFKFTILSNFKKLYYLIKQNNYFL